MLQVLECMVAAARIGRRRCDRVNRRLVLWLILALRLAGCRRVLLALGTLLRLLTGCRLLLLAKGVGHTGWQLIGKA